MPRLEDLRTVEANDILNRPQLSDTYPYYMIITASNATGMPDKIVQAINLLYERGWRLVSMTQVYGAGLSKNQTVFYAALERKIRQTSRLRPPDKT